MSSQIKTLYGAMNGLILPTTANSKYNRMVWLSDRIETVQQGFLVQLCPAPTRLYSLLVENSVLKIDWIAGRFICQKLLTISIWMKRRFTGIALRDLIEMPFVLFCHAIHYLCISRSLFSFFFYRSPHVWSQSPTTAYFAQCCLLSIDIEVASPKCLGFNFVAWNTCRCIEPNSQHWRLRKKSSKWEHKYTSSQW